MKNSLVYLIVSAVLLVEFPSIALACDCGGLSPVERAKSRKLAVVVRAEGSTGYRKLIVKKRFRGKSPDVIEVLTPILSDCARSIEKNVDYLWLTDATEDQLAQPIQITRCQYLEVADKNNEALKWLQDHDTVVERKLK